MAGRGAAATISPAARTHLIGIARAAVAAAAAGRVAPLLGAELGPPELRRLGSAFVTLRTGGALRGCMGRLDPSAPIWRNVRDAATTVARDDPRFRPVEEDELADLEIEISILGPFVALDDPADFVAGRHGIVVERGPRHALLLPQVAAENGFDGPAMLTAACRKAGLRDDAWCDAETALAVFEADVFAG